jgi:hypothetical protein
MHEVRFKVIREYMGCLCCAIELHGSGYEDIALTTIEHVTENGRRLFDEHNATIGLCPWHHQAVPWNYKTKSQMRDLLGPSLAEGRKPFEDHYGDEIHVLLALQDEMIIWFAGEPWREYTMPDKVRKRIKAKWIELKSQS